ncbi:MAG: hypothetical protein HRT94_09870 [Alphaproteobacteria bacterium]|nr:hypothetical protein [Alphaproteobacteria bacterium]
MISASLPQVLHDNSCLISHAPHPMGIAGGRGAGFEVIGYAKQIMNHFVGRGGSRRGTTSLRKKDNIIQRIFHLHSNQVVTHALTYKATRFGDVQKVISFFGIIETLFQKLQKLAGDR